MSLQVCCSGLISRIPGLLLALSLFLYNTPCVLKMACPTSHGFSLSFVQESFVELTHHRGTADTIGTVSAFTIHYLLQGIQVVTAQSEGTRDYSSSECVKTFTCNNQLFSKRQSKSCGRESGIWFVFHSPLSCASGSSERAFPRGTLGTCVFARKKIRR